MPLPPLFIRGKLSEVNLILWVVSYNRQRSHRHLQPALHPAELATGGKWTYNRQCGHDDKNPGALVFEVGNYLRNEFK